MSEAPASRPVLVAMTGATGAIYGVRLLEVLRELGVETHLVVTRWAQATVTTETDRRVDDVRALPSSTTSTTSPHRQGRVPSRPRG
jgi:flavin prenyltransferase